MKKIAIVALLAACGGPPPQEPMPPAPPPALPPPPGRTIADSIHVALGIPKDGDDSDDYLMDKGEYVLSYNPRLEVPNWVAWRLVREDLGPAPRSVGFRADETLPRELYAVKDVDYKGSGYDRGHMCPSADRTSHAAANAATFVFTNVHPQLHELNAGPWEDLEKHERELAKSGLEVYIVAGGIFGPEPHRIGHGIAVPDASFKIIVALERGHHAADVRGDTPTIAVVMPNQKSVANHAWTDFVKTIRFVEMATRYDFDSRVPRDVQEVIETKH
jgi:endonuclease G